MTDLEMTKLCAEAMGISHFPKPGDDGFHAWTYDPLHDDAQVMALVKKFRLPTAYLQDYVSGQFLWFCGDHTRGDHTRGDHTRGTDLNRAIVERVAKHEEERLAAERHKLEGERRAIEEAQRKDGYEMLATFVRRFGKLDEFKAVAKAIGPYLKEVKKEVA